MCRHTKILNSEFKSCMFPKIPHRWPFPWSTMSMNITSSGNTGVTTLTSAPATEDEASPIDEFCWGGDATRVAQEGSRLTMSADETRGDEGHEKEQPFKWVYDIPFFDIDVLMPRSTLPFAIRDVKGKDSNTITLMHRVWKWNPLQWPAPMQWRAVMLVSCARFGRQL